MGETEVSGHLVDAQVGRVPGAVGEIIVVCTLEGGEPRGVGDTLVDSVKSDVDARVVHWVCEWWGYCCT